MLKRFFITGTDTSVGKTVVSRALLQALASGGKSVAGYKPVAKGCKVCHLSSCLMRRLTQLR